MSGKLLRTTTIFLLFILTGAPLLGQTPVCKTAALKALRPIPELKYDCNEGKMGWEDEVLLSPERKKAIALYTKSLEKLAASDWWRTSVEDLNVCDFHKKAGRLSKEEKSDYEGGEYFFKLGGNNQYRIVIAKDPCYQTGFNGSNVFLLNRVGGKVIASEIIDGFFTRADFPLGFDYAVNGSETIIEISTTSGGLNPSETYYYFTIDKKTNRAVSRNLFLIAGEPENKITSDMILGEPEEYGLPPKSVALRIIKNHKLTDRFYIFENTFEPFRGQNTKFIRVLVKWNGKIYK